MIRSIYINSKEKTTSGLSLPEMQKALDNPEGLLWVSLENTNKAEALPILNDLFHFHPLIIDNCLNTGYQTPKVDDFGSYIFIVAHAFQISRGYARLKTMELNLFLGKNYLVTVFLDKRMPPVENVLDRLEKDADIARKGSDFLCHSLLDEVISEYMPALDRMDDEIEQLEDQVIERPTPQTLRRIMEIKHALTHLRRITSPQREVMNRLSREEFPMIDRQSQIYFRDVYDHIIHIQDSIESLRDIISGAMDIYLNSTSVRLNEVMKALTIVSTIFLPLSFVTGIYGMNFDWMPELNWRYGYLFIWGIFILIVVGMLAWFKKRGWF